MAALLTDDTLSMKLCIKSIKLKWSNVKTVDTTTLFMWLNDDSPTKSLILLDVREEEEYLVSHLNQAKRVNPECEDVKATLNFVKQYPAVSPEIVCYCSVGYRSTKYAEHLSHALEREYQGDDRNIPVVYNLEGSLFKWANERKSIVDNNGQSTVYVHPYNALWGKLLTKEFRKSKPD